jgi:hypothetical protein
MGAICSVCNAVRMDGRTKCKCGSTKHTSTKLTLNLRCLWCKQLFPWKPRGWGDMKTRIPQCCTDKCRGKLISWERDRKQK